MRSVFKLIILFVIILLGTTFCNKKLFVHIIVTGRVLNFWTGQPLSTGVSFTSGSNYSEEVVEIGSSHTDANGYFKIRGRASRTKFYSLVIDQDNSSIDRPLGKLEDGTTDLGNFVSGSKKYLCSIQLVSDSGRCIQMGVSNIAAGTNTIIQIPLTQTWRDTASNGAMSYSTNDCQNTSYYASHFYTLPLHFANEPVLTYTIHY